MSRSRLDRIVFHSKEDMAGPHNLKKGVQILREAATFNENDVNDVMEVYNLKQYSDNELYLADWTTEDIADFKLKAIQYGIISENL